MKPFYENLFTIDEAEGPNQSLPDFHLISIQVKFLPDFFETTRTLPSLFDFGDFSFDSHWHHGWHRFEVDHDDTWEHFGRAYYSSCDYQITEFSFTLYTVDELKRQIEEWERYFAQNLMLWVPPCLSDEVHASHSLTIILPSDHGTRNCVHGWTTIRPVSVIRSIHGRQTDIPAVPITIEPSIYIILSNQASAGVYRRQGRHRDSVAVRH